jgi:hypothetical protein
MRLLYYYQIKFSFQRNIYIQQNLALALSYSFVGILIEQYLINAIRGWKVLKRTDDKLMYLIIILFLLFFLFSLVRTLDHIPCNLMSLLFIMVEELKIESLFASLQTISIGL